MSGDKSISPWHSHCRNTWRLREVVVSAFFLETETRHHELKDGFICIIKSIPRSGEGDQKGAFICSVCNSPLGGFRVSGG